MPILRALLPVGVVGGSINDFQSKITCVRGRQIRCELCSDAFNFRFVGPNTAYVFALAAFVFALGIAISSHADYGITRLPSFACCWLQHIVRPLSPKTGKRRAVSTRAYDLAVFARATNAQNRLFGFGGNRWQHTISHASQIALSARHQGVPDAPTALAKLTEAMTFLGKDGKPLSPDDARAAIEKEAVHREQCLADAPVPWN